MYDVLEKNRKHPNFVIRIRDDRPKPFTNKHFYGLRECNFK